MNQQFKTPTDKREYREAPDGLGYYKVNYVMPDYNQIGNDIFYTYEEALIFARELESNGYNDVTMGTR